MKEPTISEQSAAFRVEAEAALTRADRASALAALMKAFELDEDDPLTLALIDRTSLGASDPKALLAVDADSRSLFRRAVRARVMMNLGQRLEATREMVRVVERAPHRSFMCWLVPWLDRAACVAVGLPSLKPLVLALVEFAGRYPVATPAPEDELGELTLRLLRAGATLVSAVRSGYPNEPQPYFGEVFIRRRLGEPEFTLGLARLAVERFPADWGCLDAMAGALEDAGQLAEARKYSERALAIGN